MSADLKHTLTSNVEELDRISDIINNLLSLSALIRPERIKFTSFELAHVVDDVVEKYAKLAQVNQQEIVVKKSPETNVSGNVTAVEQIVGNLLKNAINYTPKRGTVVITTSPAPNGFVELSIKDTGIGIPRKDLFRIFEPFYRTDQSRTRARGGTGLGLAIVSELVKLHGGKIAIRSAMGRGTTVIVQFPGTPAPAKVGSAEKSEGLHEVEVDFSQRRA